MRSTEDFMPFSLIDLQDTDLYGNDFFYLFNARHVFFFSL